MIALLGVVQLLGVLVAAAGLLLLLDRLTRGDR